MKETKSPRTIYKERISLNQDRLSRIRRIETLLSIIKLVIAALGLFVLYKIATENQDIYLYMFVSSLLIFAVPAVIHEHFIRKRLFVSTLKAINETEIKALDNEFTDYDSGKEYQDPEHAYSSDIDLFGPKSLYHLINRTTTPVGRDKLAEWLKNPPGIRQSESIKARQQAVKELAPKIDLRQYVQVYGRQVIPRHRVKGVASRMFETPFLLLDRKNIIWLIHALPILTLSAGVLMTAGLHWAFPLALILLHIQINRRFSKKMEGAYKRSAQSTSILKAYGRILAELEKSDFSTPMLRAMKKRLETPKGTVSKMIGRLSLYVSLFELRRSEILHPILNSVFFWDLHCVLHIERWRSRFSKKIGGWFKTIGEFEALSTFASLHFNQSGWVFPEPVSGKAEFKAQGLGHPLIPPHERVSNDFRMEGTGKISIVTGPNMAGKSTFLKTIGVNMVLALAGAPVCADSCRLSPFSLHTSMKVSDSLNQQISLFYAELLRLKKILEAMEGREPVFYLLDEMLKGTNALDRQAGAMALLRQMTKKNACGIVATHDLELTRLETEFTADIQNLHFDGYVEDDKLRFDYKLKPGRCESFNALTLMRKIGIDV